MKKIVFAFAAFASCLAAFAVPALAQNTTALDSNDVVNVTRRDSDGVGTAGAVTVPKLFEDIGLGYGTGAGATVTQATNRTTGVTINANTGAITLVSAAGSATPASFTVTNNKVADADVIVLNQNSGTDLLELHVTDVADGSFQITFFTTGGTTTEQPVINFAVIKGAAS